MLAMASRLRFNDPARFQPRNRRSASSTGSRFLKAWTAASAFCTLGLLLANSVAVAAPHRAAITQLLSSRTTSLPRPGPESAVSPLASRMHRGMRDGMVDRHDFPLSPPVNYFSATHSSRPSSELAAGNSVFVAEVPDSGGQFRFEHRGPITKVVPQSYRRMCDSLSRKIWDEPDGRRISFDIRGKPGIAIEIPIN